MSKIIEHFVPPHDPILGIKASNTVAFLDKSNWQTKGLVRHRRNERHYVYLNRAKALSDKTRLYCVNTYDIDRGAMLSKRIFQLEGEALAFANRAVTIGGHH